MPDPDRLTADIADGQMGLITHEQARLSGLSQDQIHRRISSGRWEHFGRGAYRVRGAVPSWRQATLGACLAGPAGAVGSYLTAAALSELTNPPARPHITVPHTCSARLTIARVHRTRLSPLDTTVITGIPATTPPRTLVDCASLLGRPSLQLVVDNALHRRLCTADEVHAAIDRAGPRRGMKTLRDLLGVWRPGIVPGSPAEVRLLRLLDAWGYPPPASQIKIYDQAGNQVARADLGWPDRRVGVEYDSDRWHGPRRWGADEVRHRSVEQTGWCLLHADMADLRAGERALRDHLARIWRARPPEPCA